MIAECSWPPVFFLGTHLSGFGMRRHRVGAFLFFVPQMRHPPFFVLQMG